MTRYTYGFSRDIALPFAEAVRTVTAAIQAEGFMALPQMNSRANSNSQAADSHLVYTVLEICDPPLMDRIIAVAFDTVTGKVVGFGTALTDGVLSAYIPLLEVLPEHRGHGIGTALVRSLLNQVEGLYMVDLTCDPEVQPFYTRLGFAPAAAMVIRRYESQSGRG